MSSSTQKIQVSFPIPQTLSGKQAEILYFFLSDLIQAVFTTYQDELIPRLVAKIGTHPDDAPSDHDPNIPYPHIDF